MARMTEITALKNWLDTEITVNHVYYWAILGVLIGGKFWWIAGAAMFINVVYAARRAAVLPRDYLKIKHKRRA